MSKFYLGESSAARCRRVLGQAGSPWSAGGVCSAISGNDDPTDLSIALVKSIREPAIYLSVNVVRSIACDDALLEYLETEIAILNLQLASK